MCTEERPEMSGIFSIILHLKTGSVTNPTACCFSARPLTNQAPVVALKAGVAGVHELSWAFDVGSKDQTQALLQVGHLPSPIDISWYEGYMIATPLATAKEKLPLLAETETEELPCCKVTFPFLPPSIFQKEVTPLSKWGTWFHLLDSGAPTKMI